jgi:Ca-activated chloride channel family protein
MRAAKLPAVLTAALLTLAACRGAQGEDERAEIDARSYVDDYQEAPDEDGAMTAAPSMVADAAETTIPVEPPPGPLEGNVFVDAGESTFVATADDAESTFALDVDTGSFTVTQAFLAEGSRPDPASIRVEEWLNAFDYGDPAPSEGAVGVTVEAGPAPRATDGTATTARRPTSRSSSTRPARWTSVLGSGS